MPTLQTRRVANSVGTVSPSVVKMTLSLRVGVYNLLKCSNSARPWIVRVSIIVLFPG